MEYRYTLIGFAIELVLKNKLRILFMMVHF